MLVRVVMELQDVPGQLLRALEPIARYGGNIQSIIHQRERKTPLGKVPVMLVFEIKDRTRLRKILAALKTRGITVTQVGEQVYTVKHAAVLVGHIVHADIRSLVDHMNSLPGTRIVDLSLSVGGPKRESAARLTILCDSEIHARRALAQLEKFCKRKDLLLVTAIGREQQ
jgi:ACT domain-containing protein